MQVTLYESCTPIQLLKKDGKSFHFARNADLTLWLFEHYESFSLFSCGTESDNNVSCAVQDCVSIQTPPHTYIHLQTNGKYHVGEDSYS